MDGLNTILEKKQCRLQASTHCTKGVYSNLHHLTAQFLPFRIITICDCLGGQFALKLTVLIDAGGISNSSSRF
jgi:hypothetical protein